MINNVMIFISFSMRVDFLLKIITKLIMLILQILQILNSFTMIVQLAAELSEMTKKVSTLSLLKFSLLFTRIKLMGITFLLNITIAN